MKKQKKKKPARQVSQRELEYARSQIRRAPPVSLAKEDRKWFIAFEQIDKGAGKSDRLISLLEVGTASPDGLHLSAYACHHLVDLLKRHRLVRGGHSGRAVQPFIVSP